MIECFYILEKTKKTKKTQKQIKQTSKQKDMLFV